MDKSPDAFRTISEAAEELDLPQHVLRFWETRFTNIKPLKRGGGRRYYRPEDVLLLKGIRFLLYDQGFTIKGVQRILKDQGIRHVISIGTGTPIENLPESMDAPEGEDDFEPRMPFDAPSVDIDGQPFLNGGHPAAPPVLAEPKPRTLDEQDKEKLSNVLRELLECKRMLERARET